MGLTVNKPKCDLLSSVMKRCFVNGSAGMPLWDALSENAARGAKSPRQCLAQTVTHAAMFEIGLHLAADAAQPGARA